MVMLGAAVFTVSVEAGSPPTRQTPYVVPKDRQGVVEVGQCELPPCVGGRPCTPNARDYGYYEGTWRQWPTQQRYDQKFPQAIGATPQKPQSRKSSALQPVNQEISDPVPVPADTDSIAVPEDSDPTPDMGNFEAPTITVPESAIVPQVVPQAQPMPQVQPAPVQPARPVDPLLDYSSNTVPGISTAPSVPAPPSLESVPAAPPALDVPAAPAEAPALEAPTAPAPIMEDDSDAELTAPAPGDDSPIIESEPVNQSSTDDALSVPMTRQEPQGEHSIIVSQNGAELAPLPQPEDPYVPLEDVAETQIQAVNPYDQAAMQVSHEEPAQDSTAANPFQTAVIPSDVASAETASQPTVQDVLQESSASPFDAPANSTEDQTGLEGFCPVTLIEKEEWVEGNAQWSVIHHGITYHLSSAAQVQKFLANPDAYTPVLDGCDPVLFAETGEKKAGTADNCVVYEGKLFMFVSEANLNRFTSNSSTYMK